MKFNNHPREIENTKLFNVILANKKYGRGNPRDNHLRIVLLAVAKVYGGKVEWTTHVHDLNDDSINCGHYFDSVVTAVHDFDKRNY